MPVQRTFGRRGRGLALGVSLGLALLLAACVEIQPLSSGPTPTVSSTVAATATAVPTQTGTIVWFPATRTPTPMATLPSRPTAELRPALGQVILRDDFTGPREWSVGQAAAGTVTYASGRLSLVTGGSKGMLVSLRGSANYTDFYAEITSSLSLCRGADNYGLLLRATSVQDYYRLLVNCSGQVRFERVANGYVTLLQDWMYSGQVPPGAPLVLRLGVWLAGSDLRVFINDIPQFSVKDATLPGGTVGVFARSAGLTPLTVDFSGLVLYQVDAARIPTPAPTATITPSPTSTRASGPTPTRTPVFQPTTAP